MGGEVEVGDLTAAVAGDADQLTLIDNVWPESGDCVRVDVTGDIYLFPACPGVFLLGKGGQQSAEN